MCQEVLQIVKNMDLRSVESQLALQCAPFIMNIRISNLFMIESEHESAVRLIFKNSGISFYRLLSTGGKTAYLLFRRSKLEKYLSDTLVQTELLKLGYNKLSLGYILRAFQDRYKRYIENGGDFPHEMGFILGYDPEDVCGFIRNEGKNYLYSGYWRVYSNVSAKKQLFAKYEAAKENIIQLMSEDIDIRLLLEIYKDESQYKMAV